MGWSLVRIKGELDDDTDYIGGGTIPATSDRKQGGAYANVRKVLLHGRWVDASGATVEGAGTVTIRPLAVMTVEGGTEVCRALSDATASWDPREILALDIPAADGLFIRLSSLSAPGSATGIEIYGQAVYR